VSAADRVESLTAYNLQISGIHTYYVGVTPVLVHNSCESDARGIQHATDRHTAGGNQYKPGNGVFDPGTDLEKLADQSRGQIGLRQSGERDSIAYVIRNDGIVGVNGDGQATNVYMLLRDPHGGDLISMYPF
jgi:hypothetical protein